MVGQINMAQSGKLSDPTAALMGRSSGSTSNSQPQDGQDFDAAKWERENVHDVYSTIASHFSATRYKPWPLVTNFLASLPPGSIGIDVGCGNGKYLHLRNLLHGDDEAVASQAGSSSLDCLTIGCDRSVELLRFAQEQSLSKMTAHAGKGKGKAKAVDTSETTTETSHERPSGANSWVNEVAVGDALSSSFRSHTFDYAISIATIHHFSTRQRRRDSIRELIRLVAPSSQPGSSGGGRFLVYVWALEQKGQERRRFDEQDGQSPQSEIDGPPQGRDVLVPWVLKGQGKHQDEAPAEEEVFQRYYHLFEESELETLVEEAAEEFRVRGTGRQISVTREDSGWERGNWWGIWRVSEAT